MDGKGLIDVHGNKIAKAVSTRTESEITNVILLEARLDTGYSAVGVKAVVAFAWLRLKAEECITISSALFLREGGPDCESAKYQEDARIHIPLAPNGNISCRAL